MVHRWDVRPLVTHLLHIRLFQKCFFLLARKLFRMGPNLPCIYTSFAPASIKLRKEKEGTKLAKLQSLESLHDVRSKATCFLLPLFSLHNLPHSFKYIVVLPSFHPIPGFTILFKRAKRATLIFKINFGATIQVNSSFIWRKNRVRFEKNVLESKYLNRTLDMK